MRGTIHPLPQYTFMVWCLVTNQNRKGQVKEKSVFWSTAPWKFTEVWR